MGQISGKWALIILTFSLMNANTFNAYTGSFQILAFGSMWLTAIGLFYIRRRQETVGPVGLLLAGCTALIVAGSGVMRS